MTPRLIPGGTSGDFLPSGEFAVGVSNGVETHLGFKAVEPPESGLLYPRVTNVGGFKFAGQGHSDDLRETWLWDGTWKKQGKSTGTSPVIFDTTGQLLIIRPAPDQTSQGYRQIGPDGHPILGDASYQVWNGLNEYTNLGDGLYIGQGNRDGSGVCVWDGNVLRQLTPGITTFVRANRNGDMVAIAYTKPEGVWLVTTTMSALRTLPLLNAPDKVPGPIVISAPEKEPLKEVSMAEPLSSSVLSIVGRYVQKFPIPQGAGPEDFDPVNNGASSRFEDKARGWVLGLAEQVRFETGDARWGVKNAGGGRPQSKDSLTFNGPRLVNYDMLSGVGTGHPVLVGQPGGEDITGQTFIPVFPVDHLGSGAGHTEPIPTPSSPQALPPVAAPPVDFKPIVDAIAALAKDIADIKLQTQVTAGEVSKANLALARIEAQLNKGFDGAIRVFGQSTTFQINPRK